MAYIVSERDTKPVSKKENVYITGHRKDIQWFRIIAEEVLDLWDCRVYVDPGTQICEKLEEHLFTLQEMNLVIVVVTKNFLMEENSARDIEFQYLKEKKISILPILMDERLADVFNSVCGDIQLLNKASADYKENLMEYLHQLFGDDELHTYVQKVFSGEIFLSYRKKDRELALQLLHLIHQFDVCQDMVVWYDDFLTLGENYEEEIEYHLTKSDIFVLLVTPNLLEEDNYVMQTEYPRACLLKKKIIPIELVPTDREALQKKYPDLPECIRISEIENIKKVLVESKQMLGWKSYPVSPERDYLLGQAYLKGISLEKDFERGMAFLRKAANADFPKAVYELGKIYYSGNGMEKNLSKAQQWLEKNVALSRREFEKEGSVECGFTLALDMMNLSDCYFHLNQIPAAKEILIQIADISEWLRKQGYIGTGSNLGNVWMRLGMICTKEERYQDAVKFYDHAEEILENMYRCSEGLQSAKSYAYVLGNQGMLYDRLFDYERNVFYLQKAIVYLEKAEQIQERVIGVYKLKDEIENLISIRTHLGQVYGKMLQIWKNPDEMIVYSEKARKLYWKLYQQNELQQRETLNRLYQYAVYTNQEGSLRENQGQMEIARGLYTEAYHIHQDMCNARGNDEDYFGLATACINLAVAGMKIPDRELLMEAYTALELLCHKNPENQQYRSYLEATLYRLQVWPMNIK